MNQLRAGSIIKGVLVVIGIIALILFIFHFLHEFLLIFTGIVLSVSVGPVVGALQKIKLNRMISVILVRQFGLIGFLISPAIAAAIQIAVTRVFEPAPVVPIPVTGPPSFKLDVIRDK